MGIKRNTNIYISYNQNIASFIKQIANRMHQYGVQSVLNFPVA